MFKKLVSLCAVALLQGGCAGGMGGGGARMPAKITMEEFRVPSDHGIQIYVRNKYASDMTQFSAAKTVVLYAPVWIRQTASLVQTGPGPTPAYRSVNMAQAKTRWLTGVPENKKADLIPAGWFEAWASATIASDPVGAQQTPPVLRAPNGVVEDGLKYWGNGIIPWKAENITVPVLLIKAEWDQDTPAYMAQNLLPKLTGAPYKRYVELGEGTHTIIMEKTA